MASRLEAEAPTRERALLASERSSERFDRLAFADTVLTRLGLQGLKVALALAATPGVALHVGRDWAAGPGARWAHVLIDRHASRRAIVAALAALQPSGVRPYLLEALVALPAAEGARSFAKRETDA